MLGKYTSRMPTMIQKYEKSATTKQSSEGKGGAIKQGRQRHLIDGLWFYDNNASRETAVRRRLCHSLASRSSFDSSPRKFSEMIEVAPRAAARSEKYTAAAIVPSVNTTTGFRHESLSQ